MHNPPLYVEAWMVLIISLLNIELHVIVRNISASMACGLQEYLSNFLRHIPKEKGAKTAIR